MPTNIDRRAKVLTSINLKGLGLEIGPSFAPFLPKRDGFNVRIADHLSTDDLKAKYKSRGVPIEKIEDVDYDLSSAPLGTVVPRSTFDYVVASHVIEHVPDLIDFLAGIWTVLKTGGTASFVVPDKRFCFDHFRPVTGLAPVIDAHMERRDKPSAGAVAEGLINYVFNLGDKRIWPANAPEDFAFRYQHEITRRAMMKAPTAYMDCHVWTYTPHNLLLLALDLSALEFFTFDLAPSFNTDPRLGEFYLSLTKTAKPPAFDRPELCRLALEEASAKGITPSRYFSD